MVGCTKGTPSSTDDSTLSIPPAVLLPSTEGTDQQTLRFLQNKIKEDPDDFIAQNKLAAWHLQRLREARAAFMAISSDARSPVSLATLPAEQNTGGLNL